MSTRQDERLISALESTGVQPALPVSNVLVAAQTDAANIRGSCCALLLQRRIGLASSVIAAPEETTPGTGCELMWSRTRIKSRWCGRVPGFQRCTGIGRLRNTRNGAGQSNRLIVADKFLSIARNVPVISVIISTNCNGFIGHEGFAVVVNCWRYLVQGIA
ncbi:hypothetical protein PpBr36_06973 [Pyricularia pennisetigena]|uniref:hypothetical protein n=1 Tax=Pyricularia pennisetigena TaxID=1578925 RepID=UPI00114DA8E9|nr:hypothetical protein PpBr36_06973 [Pyricularia pennisetigena]TLS25649.1 hypothetical protein PpBr36_06973 [Pyricularia pennisetigena]